MGTAKSIGVRRDPVTKELVTYEAGFTQSQRLKAKYLEKKPEELTKKEMQTDIIIYKKIWLKKRQKR